MVTMKCEKTGLEFEAKTRRTKNHPQVQAWLALAYEQGWYTEANAAIYGGSYAPKQTFTSIEQLNEYFAKLQKEALEWNLEEAKRQAEAKKAREEAKARRRILNAELREHGYRWSDLGFKDEEEADAFSPNLPIGSDWQLFSADGRAVSVRQAMQEIADKGMPFAQKWVEEHK